MYSPLPAAAKPVRILFVSRSESSVRTDVKALRALGSKDITHISDTASALAFLAREQERGKAIEAFAGKRLAVNVVDLIVCDEELLDGPASIFLYALAKQEALKTQPVLVLAGSSGAFRKLRSTDVHVLQRPYSTEELRQMTVKAMSAMRRPLVPEYFERAAVKGKLAIVPKRKAEPARPAVRPMEIGPESTPSQAGGEDQQVKNRLERIPARKAAVKKPLTASDWYSKGISHLRENDLHGAERAFLCALEKEDDHIDSSLGLARVHRAAGDERRMQRFLIRAAASCLRQGETRRAEAISAKLPELVRENIFTYEAVACMEENQFRAAARNFMEAIKEGQDKPMHSIVARACLLTSKPDASMERVCDAFETLGHPATAASLRRRLLTYSPFEESDPATWLDRFPRLKEVVSVASYAAWAWKQA